MSPVSVRVGVVSLGGLLLVAFVVLGILTGERPTETDARVESRLDGVWQRAAGQIAAVISVPLGPVLPAFAALLMIVAMVRAHRRGDSGRATLLFKLLVVGGLTRLVSALKPVFDRERPRLYPDLSYPSGHVTSVACTGFVLVLLAWWLARHRTRLVAMLSVLAVLICAAARLVLGVHWLTDTLGAVLGVTGIGLLAATALGLIPLRGRDRVPG